MRRNKKNVYGTIHTLANIFLIFASVIFLIYLIAPLLNGKLSFSALTHYGSWILLAIVARVVSKRGLKGLKIRVREYVFISVVALINFGIWFRFPFNIILGVLMVVGTVISYITHSKRMKHDLSTK